MKKLLLLLILIPALILPVYAATKFPQVNEGVYTAKIVDIKANEYFANENFIYFPNDATLTDSPPEDLIIDPEITLDKPRYGSFTMGNNNKKIWFMMAQDKNGYWTDFYLDQDLDYNITAAEKIKGLETWDPSTTGDGYKKYAASVTNIPIPITISYKAANDEEILKKLNIYLWASNYYKRGAEDINLVYFATVSAVEGMFKVTVGKDEKVVKYRIIDSNSNGCFNDYGIDYIYTDSNYDGKFLKKEAQKIMELFDLTVDKKKKQVRFILPPFPAKLAVVDALTEFDLSQLDPESDQK
jgi:hypothetical protein